MTEQEYKERLKSIEDDYRKRKNMLVRKFAMENNPYKIGDIVQDSLGKLKIGRIGVVCFDDIPSCVYYGVEVNKNGMPLKRQTGRAVYQINVKQQF